MAAIDGEIAAIAGNSSTQSVAADGIFASANLHGDSSAQRLLYDKASFGTSTGSKPMTCP